MVYLRGNIFVVEETRKAAKLSKLNCLEEFRPPPPDLLSKLILCEIYHFISSTVRLCSLLCHTFFSSSFFRNSCSNPSNPN